MTDAEIENTKKRFGIFGLNVIVAKDKVPGCGPVDYEQYQSINDIIDFCLENKVKSVFAEPVIFDYEELCNHLQDQAFEHLLYLAFEAEFNRLKAIYSDIEIEKFEFLLEESKDRLNSLFDVRLLELKNRDGELLTYDFKAFYLNKCIFFN